MNYYKLLFFLWIYSYEYLKGKNWKVNPDFVYCEYNSLKDYLDKDGETGDSNFRDHEDMFDSPEEQIMHFLDRASSAGWKWRSVSFVYKCNHLIPFKLKTIFEFF